MRPFFFFAFFCCLLLVCSCKAPISRDRMVEIMVDMYQFEQTIRDQLQFYPIADTTLVYAAIFHKYGYSVKDYQRSLAYHLQKPDKLKKAMIPYRDQLMKRKNALQEEMEKEIRMEKFMRDFTPRFNYTLPTEPPFSIIVDSIVHQNLDSLKRWLLYPLPDSTIHLPFIIKQKK